MRITRDNTAAIVIDYQEKLIPVIAEKEKLIENSCKLVKGLHILEVPTIVTQQYTKGLGHTIPEIREANGSDEFVEKISFSSYGDEDVKAALDNTKEYVILCGIEAHICVLQTMIDLKAAGKTPVLVEDCISSRLLSSKETALKRAAYEGVIITNYESILFELLRKAGTAESKAIQKLIK